VLLELLWSLELQSMSWFEPVARKNYPAPLTVIASKQLFSGYIQTAI